MRSLLFISVSLSGAFAFECYSGTLSPSQFPSETVNCTTQCYSQVTDSNFYIYGCDASKICYVSAAQIANGGCSTNYGTPNPPIQKTCCCNTDLCNSGGQLLSILCYILPFIVYICK